VPPSRGYSGDSEGSAGPGDHVKDTTSPTRRGTRWRVLSLLALAMLLSPRATGAQPREYEVKAAFLLNFAKFVEWPEGSFSSPREPIVLAVAGEDPFDGALERILRGRTAQGRPFSLMRFRSTDQLHPCHILFVAGSESADEWLNALERIEAPGILTVGEGRDFRRRGGISFLIEDRRVQLAVNLDAVDRARLRVSSKLLALAKVERPRDPGRRR
jgi:hypothetical protein